MKHLLMASVATCFCAATAYAGPITITNSFDTMPGLSGSLDVDEQAVGAGGVYNVTNNTGGSLLAFGVSNASLTSVASFNPNGIDNFACANPNSGPGNLFCYEATNIDESDWNTEIAYSDFLDATGFVEYTFQDAFGDFSDVAGDDVTFNWFFAVDGDLQDGATSNNFFGFFNAIPASQIIGIAQNGNGAAAFTAGVPASATPAVPLPAAGWMLIAGLGGLAAAGRRKKS